MDSVSRGLVLTLVILGLVALSGPFMMGGMMGPGWMGTDGGWRGGMMWGVGGVTMLEFLAVAVVGIVVLLRVLDRDKNGPAYQELQSGAPHISSASPRSMEWFRISSRLAATCSDRCTTVYSGHGRLRNGRRRRAPAELSTAGMGQRRAVLAKLTEPSPKA